METTSVNVVDPIVQAENIQRMLQEVIDHTRQDVDQLEDPRFQALLERSAEVLKGLKTAFAYYQEGSEKTWRRRAYGRTVY